MQANPFKPTAGKMPPILIGRQSIIDDFVEGLDNGAGAPGRLMLITGQRGYGKTVMLTELSRVAKAHDWQVISDTASGGLCARLVESLTQRGAHIAQAAFDPSVTIAGLASVHVGSIGIAQDEQASLTLRNAIDERLKKTKRGKGILFAIDETQAASKDDLIAIGTAVQHAIRDQDMLDVPDDQKKGIAFIFAALPSLMDEVLNDEVLTFLRRSLQRHLGDIAIQDVRDAYLQTVESSGKRISAETALVAASKTQGYPYMIQLVGYYMWQSAQRRDSDRIGDKDVEIGIEDAGLAFDAAVCAPTYKGLTTSQQTFIDAMTEDLPEPSTVTAIAERTGMSRSWASKYRRSLIDAQVIEAIDHGHVAFSNSAFGGYVKKRVRENA